MKQNSKYIEIIQPGIFERNKIISGVTLSNREHFPPNGISFSFNQSFPDNEIENNRRMFSEFLRVRQNYIKFQKQVHGTSIRIINSDSIEEESDAMITSYKGIVLCVKIADCLAVLLFDPVKNIIGAVHSGWRGTKEKITTKTIELMTSLFNSVPDDIQVYLTPCASGKMYEVGWDVAQFFPASVTESENSKYLFDNSSEVRDQLISSGIKPANIEISNRCTIEDHSFHSYRRDKELSGRMAAFIGMKV